MSHSNTLTLGSFVKLLFDISGIFPIKGEEDVVFNQDERDNLRKLLRRLEKETCDLTKNYSKAVDKLVETLRAVCPDEMLAFFCMEIIDEVEAVYKKTLQEDGTYLDAKGTLKWMLNETLCSRLVLSLHKNYYRYSINLLMLPMPKQPYWFLPDSNNTKITPLSTYLKWLYESLNTSQTSFYCPKDCLDLEDFIQDRHLNNAQKWTRGDRIPSWAGLKQNLTDGLSAQTTLNEKQKTDILFMAFVARLASSACDVIEKAFGQEYLLYLIEQYKLFDRSFAQHKQDMEAIAFHALKSTPVTPYWLINTSVRDEINLYWELVSDEELHLARQLQAVQIKKLENGEHYHIQDYREYFRSEFMYLGLSNALEVAIKPPVLVAEIIGECYSMIKKHSVDIVKVEALEKKLTASTEACTLRWYLLWIRGKAAYECNNMEEALEYYDQAFMHAKYRAGRNQKQLVNELILISAKCNNWRIFKKVVLWADFLDIKIQRTFFPVDTLPEMKAFFKHLQEANWRL